MVEVRDLAQYARTPIRRWEDAQMLPVALGILPLFVFCPCLYWLMPVLRSVFLLLLKALSTPLGLGLLVSLCLKNSSVFRVRAGEVCATALAVYPKA